MSRSSPTPFPPCPALREIGLDPHSKEVLSEILEHLQPDSWSWACAAGYCIRHARSSNPNQEVAQRVRGEEPDRIVIPKAWVRSLTKGQVDWFGVLVQSQLDGMEQDLRDISTTDISDKILPKLVRQLCEDREWLETAMTAVGDRTDADVSRSIASFDMMAVPVVAGLPEPVGPKPALLQVAAWASPDAWWVRS